MAYELRQYRTAVSLVLSRMRWDLCRVGVANRRRLRRWRDRFPGDRAVVLCNGPSLNRVDVAHLASTGVFCFGLNKINLLFDRTEFRPSAVVAVNPFVISQNAEFYNSTEIPLFLDRHGAQAGGISDRDSVTLLHSSGPTGTFSRDASTGVNQGHTVTYVALQLAYYMGFTSVALVGCDHSFATKGPANMTVSSDETDPNHFDSRYFAGGQQWQLPDLVASEFHYQIADIVFREAGRRIVNCTEGGKLEIFERGDLMGFLG